MSIAVIIGIIIATISALFGGLAGRSLGKSQGKTEGAAQATADINAKQSQQAATSAQERTHAEIAVAADTDDELDSRLQKHDRAS